VTLDAPAIVSADLDIRPLSPDPDPLGRALEALRAFRLVGHLAVDAYGGPGDLTATVAFIPGRGLAVDTGNALAPTPAQAIVDALSARLGAAIALETDNDGYYAEPAATPGAQTDPEPPARDPRTARDAGTAVYAVRGRLPLAEDRRGELASQLDSSVTAVPVGEWTLVGLHDEPQTTYWSRAQRPVVGLHRAQDRLLVQLYSATAARRGRLRDRIATMTYPDWVGGWVPAPVPLATEEAGSAAAIAVQEDLAAQRAAVHADLGVLDDAVRAELGLEAVSLAELLARPLDDEIVDEICRLLGLPALVAGVLRGDERLSERADAVTIENRGVRGAVADGLLGEPDGASLWARWRRIPHRHPRTAVALIVAELAVAGALAVAAVSPLVGPPWTAALWIAAAVLGLDAVGDAVLLAKIRDRRKENPGQKDI